MALLFAGLTACNGGGGGNSSTEEQALSEDSQTPGLPLRKIHVDEAQIEELAQHKATCSAKDDKNGKQICVLICHVPPGNPKAAKDKVIPLQALRAHLNHGHAHHGQRDFLGSCSQPFVDEDSEDNSPIVDDNEPVTDEDSENSDNDNSDSNDSDSDSEEPLPEDDPNVEEPGTDIPLWCERFYEIDRNCDGFNDENGDPIL